MKVNWEKPGYVGLASAQCWNVIRFCPIKPFSFIKIVKTKMQALHILNNTLLLFLKKPAGQVFVKSYLLFWPAFIWQMFLEKKNSAGCLRNNKLTDENFLFQRQFLVKLKCSVFSLVTFFRRQPAEFFYSKIICQMKAGQYNKYDITNA